MYIFSCSNKFIRLLVGRYQNMLKEVLMAGGERLWAQKTSRITEQRKL